jgi:hypothetical protein
VGGVASPRYDSDDRGFSLYRIVVVVVMVCFRQNIAMKVSEGTNPNRPSPARAPLLKEAPLQQAQP